MLTCKELTELVTDYLEGRLPMGRRMSFWVHASMCPHCRAYLRQMRASIRATGSLPAAPMPPEVRDALLARFRGWKAKA